MRHRPDAYARTATTTQSGRIHVTGVGSRVSATVANMAGNTTQHRKGLEMDSIYKRMLEAISRDHAAWEANLRDQVAFEASVRATIDAL